MNNEKNSLKHLSLPFNTKLNDALIQQHHAAQFIALVGHHLITQQPDDSNTTMEYLKDENILIGDLLPNEYQMALQLSNLKLYFLNELKNFKREIILEGKTKLEVFNELKHNLSYVGLDISVLNNELHYDMPSHQLDKGAVFSIINENDFIENSTFRHNADLIINEIANSIEKADPVRIWPHHFDTGSVIPVEYNDKGELTKSVGIGWAIPDSMVDEPYYYLSFWTAKPIKNTENFKPLDFGKWMLPDWNGAILKHSDIIQQKTAIEQYKMVKSFFNKGIEILLTHLQNN